MAFSPIVTNDFQTVLDTNVQKYFQNQKKLAITMIAVGVILTIGAMVALAYTTKLNPVIPTAFSFIMVGGLVIGISPLRKDWKPYHTKEYFNEVHHRFVKFEDSDFDGLKQLFKDFRFDKLKQFAYIGPNVADVRDNCVQDFQKNTPDADRTALQKWNEQFAQK